MGNQTPPPIHVANEIEENIEREKYKCQESEQDCKEIVVHGTNLAYIFAIILSLPKPIKLQLYNLPQITWPALYLIYLHIFEKQSIENGEIQVNLIGEILFPHFPSFFNRPGPQAGSIHSIEVCVCLYVWVSPYIFSRPLIGPQIT